MYVHSGTESLISQETIQNYVILHHLTTAETPYPITTYPTAPNQPNTT